MLLRTQMTLLMAAAIVVIGVVVGIIGQIQRNYDSDRLAQIVVTLQSSLWDNLVAQTAVPLRTEAVQIANLLATAVPDLERVAVAETLGERDDSMTVQVIRADGTFVAATRPLLGVRPLVDQKVLETLPPLYEPLTGVRQDTPQRFVVLAVAPIIAGDRLLGAVSVSVDAQEPLTALSQEVREPAFLLSPRGRLASGTDPALWAAAQVDIPRRLRGARFVDVGARTYFAAPFPVRDIAGGQAGTLVALRDVSESRDAIRAVQRGGLAAIGFLALIILTAAYFLLRRAFQPLEGAVQALDALARGDMSRPVDAGGAREIAQIGKAVVVFRRNAIRLTEQDEAISRQRRRQERVIRRELERLAGLLDEDGRREVLGDLSAVLDQQDAGTTRSNAELATLATLLQRMAHRIASQQGRLTALVAELRASIATRERLAAIEQELDIARALQTSFLPKPLPPHPAFEEHGLMQTAKEVGGDFFDAFFIDPQHLAITVADVSGKGVPAALFMAITRTLIRANADGTLTPAETVSRVNTVLAQDNEQMMFVTLFYGVLDLETGNFTTVNAGHNPPYLVTGGKVNAFDRAGQPALGVVEDFPFTQTTMTLEPGALFYAFTDGVTEAFNVADEAFGEPRLEALLANDITDTTSAQAVAVAVHDAVIAFEGEADQADDITSFALRYWGSTKPTEGVS